MHAALESIFRAVDEEYNKLTVVADNRSEEISDVTPVVTPKERDNGDVSNYELPITTTTIRLSPLPKNTIEVTNNENMVGSVLPIKIMDETKAVTLPVKRGRGRPRKDQQQIPHPIQSTNPVISESFKILPSNNVSLPTPAPRQNQIESSKEDFSDDDDDSLQDDDDYEEDFMDEHIISKKEKRGRGRPKKYITNPPVSMPTFPTVSSNEVPARRRGRPRKNPNQSSENLPENTEKKKRGRPRKTPLPNVDVIHTINLAKSVVPDVRNNTVPIKKRKIEPLSENLNQSLKNDSSNWLDISTPLKKRMIRSLFDKENI